MITEADIELLRMQLDKHGNGAQAHITNKARTYLGMVADKPDSHFSNCTADEFVQHIRKALYHGEWEPLDKLMSRWW